MVFRQGVTLLRLFSELLTILFSLENNESACCLPVKIVHFHCLAWKFTGCDAQMQKILGCVLSEELLMEQTGGRTRRRQGNLLHFLWDFQACLAEVHTLRVGLLGWCVTFPTLGRNWLTLQDSFSTGWNWVPLKQVPPAPALLASSSLK